MGLTGTQRQPYWQTVAIDEVPPAVVGGGSLGKFQQKLFIWSK
jgi:hypothetical protein